MPVFLALAASVLLHAAALVGPGWMLPGTLEPDPPPVIDAVLAKPPARVERPPAARPTPKPHGARPRPSSGEPAVAVAEVPAPTPAAPVETPPVAVAGPRSGFPGTQSEPAPTPEPAPAPASAPPAPAPARIALPARGQIRYAITRGEGGFVVGQALHSWEHDGFIYRLQSVTETTGLAALFKPARVVQSSQGEVTSEGLKPREFRHERVAGLDRASFDWARRVVAYAGREDAIGAGVQDMLSMYYQLVLLAPASGVLEMPIATGRKLENYRFEVLGEETVALPGGERRGLRLRTRSGNDIIELWIAADLRGLPLKIRFTDRKGEIFDQLAADIDIQETQ